MLDTKGFKEFIELDARKKELTEELEDVKKKLKANQQFLIDNLETNEMSKISVAGKTCYIKNSTFAMVKNKKDGIRVLREAGFEDYIKEGFNTNSISKLVRDQLAEHEKLPDSFGDIITVGTRTDLSVIIS